MATWAFKHYRLHEGGISLHTLMFWFWIKVFQVAFVRTKFSFPRVDVLQKAPRFQLSTPKVEGQEHLTFGLQLLTPKVNVATLALGSLLKQGLAKVQAKNATQKLHFMLLGVWESVKEWTSTLPSDIPLSKSEPWWTPESLESNCKGQNPLD
jgi:hypothetical protein